MKKNVELHYLCESIVENFAQILSVAVKLLTVRYSLFADFQENSVQKQRLANNEQRTVRFRDSTLDSHYLLT